MDCILNKGRKFSKETRERMSRARKGKIGWNKGLTAKTDKRIKSGKNHPNWVGDKIKYFDKRIRRSGEYIQWRSDIFQRDNWICQTCKVKGGYLEAHHIKPFIIILKENNIKTFDDALKCEELWDRNNGITLCSSCHQLTKSYKKKYDYKK